MTAEGWRRGLRPSAIGGEDKQDPQPGCEHLSSISVWLDEAEPARTPLAADDHADVAVVGGGLSGIIAALALSDAGARVIVLEARGVAQSASGRNAGFLLAGLAENHAAATRRYGAERANRIYEATRRSREHVRGLVARERIACDLEWLGSDLVAASDEEWREVEESARLLRALGAQVTVDAAARTATFPEDGAVHPVRLVRGLARAAERAGARIHEGSPALEVSADRVRTATATVTAGAVLVCTNAYARHLVDVPVRPVRGQMLATAPLPARVFPRPAYADRGYRYWRQLADGRLLVGGWRNVAMAEEVGEDETPTSRVQQRLESFLRERVPAAIVTHRWAGTMGFSADGLPYAGRLASRVWVLAGCTGHGLGLFPELAHLVAAAIRGGGESELALFDPAR